MPEAMAHPKRVSDSIAYFCTVRTVDAELAVRHAEQRHRRAGGRTTGPDPFRDEDRDRFRESLLRLLREGPGPMTAPSSTV